MRPCEMQLQMFSYVCASKIHADSINSVYL